VTRSVLFYVQHLLGIGHLRRALCLVEGLAAEGFAVTLVSGGEPFPGLAATGAARVVQLPPIRAADAAFSDLVGADGRPVDAALRAARREALLAAFATAAPEAVVIEAFPFGRRAFRFELDPLIAAARARRPPARIVASIRDILVVREPRYREIVARVRADFDLVLVHGDPTLIALDASFPAAPEIADRLAYTGYVREPPQPAAPGDASGAGEVLVSAGGGAVGGALLAAALEARRGGCLAECTWRLLAGPNLPEAEFAALASALPERVVVERYRPEFPRMLRRCRISISQAGYNTVLDIMAARAAAVVVPFAAGRETEQALRAELLAARGAVEIVAEAELSPPALARAVARALARPPKAIAIDTDGARRSAALIEALLARGSVKLNMKPS
jgi:predicted glycosyltransferase